ncbi:MAG: ATPase domain-containing protein [Candidatus Micrarchaeota archaeon]
MELTAFPSLEPILKGGLPKGDQILVSGPPGSGKTILCMHYIFEGIKKGENGVFFTLDSEKDYLIEQMRGLGVDAHKLIEGGKLDIVELNPADIYLLLDDMAKHVKRLEAKRIVLDSLSILSVYCGSYRNLPEDLISFLDKVKSQPPIALGDSIQKQMIYAVLSEIRKFGCTALLISELSRDSKWYSRDTISEFACDGIILLEYHIMGAAGVTRTLSIVKMRKSKYREGVYEFRITEKGIEVSEVDE